MADVKLYTGKYPVVELTGINNLGVNEIKSCTKATAFTGALMNGMAVVVDEAKDEASLPADCSKTVWLHASVEKLYASNEVRSDFAVLNNDGFLARHYRFKLGQKFETNAVVYDSAVFADYSAIKTYIASNKVYAIPDASGLWRLVKTIPASAPIPVTYGEVKLVTLPNGENGVQIVMTKVTY